MLHPLDRALALHCSPALAGIKAGNLVSLNRSAIPELDGRLDAYRQIKEKIEDMRKRIELLTDVKETGQELVTLQTDMIRAERFYPLH